MYAPGPNFKRASRIDGESERWVNAGLAESRLVVGTHGGNGKWAREV